MEQGQGVHGVQDQASDVGSRRSSGRERKTKKFYDEENIFEM